MAFIPVPDGALAVLEYGGEEDRWTNTLWFTQTAFGIPEMEDLVGALSGWVATQIMPWLVTTWLIQEITIYDMRSATAPKIESTAIPTAGLRPGTPSAVNAALVVSFYTGLRGRSGRGRNYVTGFSETDAGSDAVTDSAVVNGIEDAYQALFAAAAAVGWAWSVVQKYEDLVPLASGVARPVLSTRVRNSKYGSQRRRVDRA